MSGYTEKGDCGAISPDMAEPWSEWEAYAEEPDEPMNTVYPYVPIELVRALVNTHGGEANETQQ